MAIIAPSILSADFTRLGEELSAIETAKAGWVHIDVMDGHFVPNISYGPIIIKACRKATRLLLDVHLMIENPDRYIPEFAAAGADLICVHAETTSHLHRTVQLIKSLKNNQGDALRAGVALNPATPPAVVEWVLDELAFVLVMSVNPGFGGQAFIPSSLDKIAMLRRMIQERRADTIIQVDGGVGPGTIQEIAAAGADCFVAGSAVFNTPDYSATITDMLEKADRGASQRQRP